MSSHSLELSRLLLLPTHPHYPHSARRKGDSVSEEVSGISVDSTVFSSGESDITRANGSSLNDLAPTSMRSSRRRMSATKAGLPQTTIPVLSHKSSLPNHTLSSNNEDSFKMPHTSEPQNSFRNTPSFNAHNYSPLEPSPTRSSPHQLTTIHIDQYHADLLSLQKKQEHMQNALRNLNALQDELKHKQIQLNNFHNDLTQRDFNLAQREMRCNELNAKITDQLQKIDDKDKILTNAEQALKQKEARLSQRETKLNHDEYSYSQRLDALTKKEIDLENKFMQREKLLLEKEARLDDILLHTERTKQNTHNTDDPLSNDVHSLSHHIHNPVPHELASRHDDIESKYMHLDSISKTLVQKKEELELFEKELLLRESQLSAPRDTSPDHNKTIELQEIAINIAEECKQVMHDLHIREHALNEREVKLKQMVKLVQSIQTRQRVAKEELNRAIEKDENKIREKMHQLEERERRIELLEERLRIAVEQIDDLSQRDHIHSTVQTLRNEFASHVRRSKEET